MLPVCTCGYCIANGEWHLLFGAAYLFVINTYFIYIYASSCVVLSLLGIPRVKELSEKEWKRLRRKSIRNTVIALLPIILITFQIG